MKTAIEKFYYTKVHGTRIYNLIFYYIFMHKIIISIYQKYIDIYFSYNDVNVMLFSFNSL